MGRKRVDFRSHRGATRAPHLGKIRQEAGKLFEILFECRTSGGAEMISALGLSAFKSLVANHIPCHFQPPRLNAQIAVRSLEKIPQLRKRQGFLHHQCRQYTKAQALVD
jgi:hypothetical protein